MGGLGSGNWYRWDTRTTTEQVHSVDIRYLKKRGFLKAGVAGTLSWSCGGEQTGWIRFKTSSDSLQLIYKLKQSGEDWISKDERIAFDWTHCNYGGKRQWLLCPHCGKRVAIVYGLGSGFLCRHCYALSYASQGETYLDRMIRKTRKLRSKIDGDIDLETPIFRKPKGMHWRTFNRQVNLEKRINELVQHGIEKKIMILTKFI